MDEITGVGIGVSVGVGTVVALAVLVPQASLYQFVVTFVFYGGFSGFFFHIWKKALEGLKLPFGPNRR